MAALRRSAVDAFLDPSDDLQYGRTAGKANPRLIANTLRLIYVNVASDPRRDRSVLLTLEHTQTNGRP